MLKKLMNIILDLFFPPRCAICNKVGYFVCPRCDSKIIEAKEFRCPFCGSLSKKGRLCPRCRRKNQLTGVIFCGYFKDENLRKIIIEYKYHGIFSLADYLAELLAKRYRQSGVKVDLIVPVPRDKKRFRERGYDQTALLAKKLAKSLGVNYAEILRKTRKTQSQVGLRRQERIMNLKGAFSLDLPSEEKLNLKNKTILVIDDVFTTGATLNECAQVLRTIGPKAIWGLVIAKE